MLELESQIICKSDKLLYLIIICFKLNLKNSIGKIFIKYNEKYNYEGMFENNKKNIDNFNICMINVVDIVCNEYIKYF